jgi:hypothetical protein
LACSHVSSPGHSSQHFRFVTVVSVIKGALTNVWWGPHELICEIPKCLLDLSIKFDKRWHRRLIDHCANEVKQSATKRA